MNPLKWWKKPEQLENTAIRPELNPDPVETGCSAYAAEVMAEQPEKANPFLALDAAKGVIPANSKYAMDAAVIGFHDLQYSEPNLPYVKPLSYGTLSLLSLDSLIRKGVDALADAMTRKWIDIQHTGEDNPKKLKALTDALESFKVQKKFREAASKQGFFGGCFLFIDMGDDTDTAKGAEEVKMPLRIDAKKIKRGDFKGLQIIEPWVCAPFYNNTTNPLKPDYYEAELWFVMGKQVHRSRLLRFVQNEVSQQLKPAFFGFGIAQAQLVLDYVEKFFTTRSSIVDLVDKFSVSILATDMKQLLSGVNSIAAAGSLKNRIDVFNSTRNNRRTMALDKDKEEYTQVNTPMTGLADILTKNLEFVAAAFAMPATELTGISPSGFQATGENEKRSWYDRVLSMQEKMFTDPLRSVIDIIQLSEFGEIDSDITFKFKPLQEMSEAEIADIQSKKAATGGGLIMSGAITPEEERARLRDDPESGYSGLEDEALPKVTEEDGEAQNALQELYSQIGVEIANDAAHWITVHGGKDGEGSSHVMLDGEGNVIAGAGGKLDGKRFSPKSKSDDVTQHSARPQQTVTKLKQEKTAPHENSSLFGLQNNEKDVKLPSEGQGNEAKKPKLRGIKWKNVKFGKYTVNHEQGIIKVNDDPSHPWKGEVSGRLSADGKYLDCGIARRRDNGKEVRLSISLEGKPELQAAAKEMQKVKTEKAAKKAAVLPNLSSLEKIEADLENTYYAYQRKSEHGYPQKEAAAWKAAEETAKAAREQYPAEAAYLKAESFSQSSNYDKRNAGKKAMEAISGGADYNQAISDMEKEWSEAAMRNAINS